MATTSIENPIATLVGRANEIGVSDIHLIYGVPARCRKDGSIQNLINDIPLTDEDCTNYAKELSGNYFDQIKDIGELDLAHTYNGVRVRINVFKQQGHFSAVLRLLSNKIPDMSVLGLPKPVFKFPEMQKGIVLVTGETGSGKSTTLASILDRINHTRSEHIITLEDPIEYIYQQDKCIINQREIGKDTMSFDNGLRAILREDPDIILVGELRDFKTIETALTASETGHLVFATLHTNSASDAIDRLVGCFPGDQRNQARMQISTCLNAVLSQQLIVKKGGGRVLACELMMVNMAIRNLIREGKTPQIANAISTGAQDGSITMDMYLAKLVQKGIVTKEVALAACHDSENFLNCLGR